jgi:hypothetical protein
LFAKGRVRDATRPGLFGRAANRLVRSDLLEGETDLQDNLVVLHLAALDMPAGLHKLESAELLQRARCSGDGGVGCILNGLLRGARNFNDPVYVVLHWYSPL